MSKFKRYVVTMDFYLYAENDDEAVKEALKIAYEEDKKHDNKCTVVSINEQPTGRLGFREVKLNK